MINVNPKIVEMKVKEIQPAAYNPREISDAAFAGLQESMRKFGLLEFPILNRQTGNLVSGHQRVKALIADGVKKVQVIEVDWDELTEKAANVTLNSQQIAGVFTAALAPIVEQLRAGLPDDEFLNLRIEELRGEIADMAADIPGEGLTDPDAVPEVPEEPVSKLGDVWLLGEHRLMCGDSTKAEDVERLMQGEKAELCFTSPPYNAGSLNVKGNKETQRKYESLGDNKSEDEYLDFLSTSMMCMLSVCDEVFYNLGIVENNKRAIFELVTIYRQRFKDVLYWKKKTVAPHIQPGVVNNLVEFILCFGDGKRKFVHAQFSQGTYWNVVEGNNASSNEFANIHKATFPVYLPMEIIQNFSNSKAIVLDPFSGSGTTIIACEQLGRKCRAMEISPQYVDVAVKRWEEFTGQKAELEAASKPLKKKATCGKKKKAKAKTAGKAAGKASR